MIYQDETQYPVCRSIELVDGVDHLYVRASCFLTTNTGIDSLVAMGVCVEGNDIRALIAELTAIADKRGF